MDPTKDISDSDAAESTVDALESVQAEIQATLEQVEAVTEAAAETPQVAAGPEVLAAPVTGPTPQAEESVEAEPEEAAPLKVDTPSTPDPDAIDMPISAKVVAPSEDQAAPEVPAAAAETAPAPEAPVSEPTLEPKKEEPPQVAADEPTKLEDIIIEVGDDEMPPPAVPGTTTDAAVIPEAPSSSAPKESQPIAISVPDILTKPEPVQQPLPVEELDTNDEPEVTSNPNPALPSNPIPGVTHPMATDVHHSNNFSSYHKRRSIIFGLIIVVLVVLLAGVAVFAYSTLTASALSAQEAFQKFPTKALRYTSLTQTFDADLGVGTFKGKGDFDFSNPQKVLSDVYIEADVSFFVNLSYAQQVITTEDSQFMKIDRYELEGLEELSLDVDPADVSSVALLENHWVEVGGQDNSSLSESFGDTGSIVDGLNTVLGELVTGNLTDNQMTSVEKFLSEKPVYSYSTEPVEEMVRGIEAYRYDVAINSDQLREYNELIADLTNVEGLDDEAIQDSYQNVAFWVSKESADILRISYSFDNSGLEYTGSVDYSAHNEPVAISPPDTFLSAPEAEAVLSGEVKLGESTDDTETEDTSIEDESTEDRPGAEEEPVVDDDTVRKTNINIVHVSLETYFADNGMYPTVASMINTGWIIENMTSIHSDNLVDPDGGPAFSYITTTPGCDNVDIACTSYILSTDLGEDGRGLSDADNNSADYVKNSLN